YGLTCNSYVGSVDVKNAYFHHNYRKGFDTHGCLNVTMDNCLFDSNVIYHFALLAWDIYTTVNKVNIGATLKQTDKKIMHSSVQALITNQFKGEVRHQDFLISDKT